MTEAPLLAARIAAAAAAMVVFASISGARAQGADGQRQPSAGQAAQLAQQNRMRSCNADAGTRNLSGDTRRAFMGDRLAGRSAAEANAAPAPSPSGGAARN